MGNRQRMPSIEKKARELIASVPFSSKDEKKVVAYHALKQMSAAIEAVNEMKALFIRGMERDDPALLLASMQVLHDRLTAIVAKEDNGIQHAVTVRPDNFVTEAIDRCTHNEYTISTSESYMRGIELARHIRLELRDVAQPVLEEYRAEMRERIDRRAGMEAPGQDGIVEGGDRNDEARSGFGV